MTERDVILKVDNLGKKYYKQANYAIQNISFEVLKGQIVGVLGSNGAGKSTTLKCITGMLSPTVGNIEICGINIKEKPLKAKEYISFVTDNHSVFEKMTGIQYINFLADIYKVPTDKRKETLKELENIFGLGDNINNLICSYSHGMKQKICMMGSLIHTPELWVMDEPMIGLDPTTRTKVYQYMQDYAQKGHSILFSSHNLDAIKKLCHRAIIIDKGIMQADLDLESILKNNPEYYFDEYYEKLDASTIEKNDQED